MSGELEQALDDIYERRALTFTREDTVGRWS
jgi:hypothetical protein